MNAIYKPASLTEWLEIATDGLAVPGKQRVRREIGAHFAQAVKAHLDQGESKPVAEINALEELGDAKTARKNFRKRHLTRDEEKQLEKLRGMARSNFLLATNLIMGFAFSFWLLQADPIGNLLICVPVILALVILPAFAFWSLRLPDRESKLSSVLAVQCFAISPAIIPIACTLSWDNRPFTGGSRLLLFMVLSIWFSFSIRAFHIWRKIRRNENPAIGV